MAFLKKQAAAPAEPFRVPSLSEAHSEYGQLSERLTTLNKTIADLRSEERALVLAISKDDTPNLRPGVAALLGEKQSPKAANVDRLKDVRSMMVDVNDALAISMKRRRDLETAASVAVFHTVRPEIEKRMSVLLQALASVDEARRAVDDVVLAIEAEGAESSLLGPLRTNSLSNQIGVFTRSAKEAGYV